MKQGWEIKKLGEVATIVGGSTPKTNDFANWGGSNYWVTPAELTGNKWISSTERTITDLGVKNAHLQILPVGTVLLSSRAPIGKVAITTVEMYCNQGFKNIVCSKNILNEFVYWFLFHNTDYLNSLGTGATFKEISKRVVEQIPIPVPERAEQERIVGELDCLSGIIAAKRAQLRELDTLAQSIFYTMFGDPITNDKGWQTKALGNVCVVNPPKKDTLADVQSDDFVSFIPMEDLSVKAGYVKSKQQRLCKDVQSSYTCFADNDILMAKVTPCFENGKVGITQNLVNGIGFGSSEFIVIRPVNVIKEYVYFVIQTPIFIDEAVKRLTGTSGLRRVPRTYVEECIISIPPIDLQQQFAEKIENIERQKELITKSIKETEDLFNSRMDYYFN